MPDRIVYKVMFAAELQQMQHDGVFDGSPADMKDGFIHLSCGSQLAATLDKHFSGVEGLMLVAWTCRGLAIACDGNPRAAESCSHTSMAICRSKPW